ncbi:hypothetical protein ES703_51871 [subsurface metagenome]
MQVDKIHLVPGQITNRLFQIIHLPVLAPRIYHNPTLFILRIITRDAPFNRFARARLLEHLQNTLCPIENTIRSIGSNCQLTCNFKKVPLFAYPRIPVIQGQKDIP